MKRTSRIPQLDGLRGLAILMVLIWHYVACQMDPRWGSLGTETLGFRLATTFHALICMTWSGVDLFFVLSGFLLGGILIDHRTSPSFFRTFYIRRVCRLFPLYYLVLFLFGLATLAQLSRVCPGLHWLLDRPLPMWSYATFTQNFQTAFRGGFGPNWLGVTWSLAVEEQFYLILPLIVYFTARRSLPFVLMTLILAAPLLRAALVINRPDLAGISNYVLMICRADSLLLGVLGAWLLRHGSVAEILRENHKHLNLILWILLSGIALFSLSVLSSASQVMGTFGYSWMAIAYLVVLLSSLTAEKGLILSICNARWLQRLGNISYGVYLLHQIVSGVCHGLILGRAPILSDLAGVAVTILALSLTLGLAALLYRFVEKPIIEYGHSFRYESAPMVEVGKELHSERRTLSTGPA